MIGKGYILTIPHESRIHYKIDPLYKTDDAFYTASHRFNNRYETYNIHLLTKTCKPKTLIRITDIIGVSVAPYRTKSGKTFDIINIYIRFEEISKEDYKKILKQARKKDNISVLQKELMNNNNYNTSSEDEDIEFFGEPDLSDYL